MLTYKQLLKKWVQCMTLNNFLQIYHEAIDEPYSFLYINLMQKDRSNMFMEQFSHYLNPS